MSKKRIYIQAACLLLLLLLSGCKRVTAQELLKDAARNAKKIENAKGTMDLDVGLRAGQGAFSMNVEAGFAGDWEAAYTQGLFHMDGVARANLLNFSTDMEAYITGEKEQATAYVKLGKQWFREEAAREEASSMDAAQIWKIYTTLEDFSLEEETQDVAGEEAYVVTGTLEGKVLESLLARSGALLTGQEALTNGVKLSGISADVTLQIYKKSGNLASLTIACTDGLEGLADGSGISVTSLSLTMVFDEYNYEGSLQVPEEAQEAQEFGKASVLGSLLGIG